MTSDQEPIFVLDEPKLGFIYTGAPLQPRNTIIKIKNNLIEAPIRIPNFSNKSINLRHPNQMKIEKLEFSNLIKFIIDLTTPMTFSYEMQNKLNDNKNGSSSQISYFHLEETELNLQLLNDSIPITENLMKDISAGNQTNLLELFETILIRTSRNTRQKALTKLCLNKSLEATCLILMLLFIRSELRCSVLRELGRLKISNQFLVSAAEILLNEDSIDQISKHYSFLYLFSIDETNVRFHQRNKLLIASSMEFASISDSLYWNQIMSKLKENPFETYLHLVNLSKSSKSSISRFLKIHYTKYNDIKANLKDFKFALSHLLKFGEVTANPILIGFILCFTSLGSRTVYHGDQEVKTIPGQIKFQTQYLSNRAVKQLEIWDKNGLSNLTDDCIRFYLANYPHEIDNTSFSVIVDNASDVNFIDSWKTNNLILERFSERITQLLSKKATGIQIMKDLFQTNQVYLPTALMNFIGWKGLPKLISKLEVSDQIQAYLFPNSRENDFVILQELDESVKEDLLFTESQFHITRRLNAGKIIEIFARYSKFIPLNLFEVIVDQIVKIKHINLDSFFEYISELNHNSDRELSDSYLNLILDRLSLNLTKIRDNESIKFLIQNIIIDWEQLTYQRLDEVISNKIDALKIAVEDLLKTSQKINTWDPVAIETIVETYKLSKGAIPSFIEASVATSLNRPNWDQLARHYLAMGIYRPIKSALKNSQLKEVPSRMSDVLGKIALISETIAYCQRNGFNASFENVITKNIYQRGWNIDRGHSDQIPGLLGNVSPRTRSFLAAYLVLERGDMTTDILWSAKDVNNYQIRQALFRALERFGTAEMWFILSHSLYNDLADQAINQLKETRISKEDKPNMTLRLIMSNSLKVAALGFNWFKELLSENEKLQNIILSSQWKFMSNLLNSQLRITGKQKENQAIFELCNTLIWDPTTRVELQDVALSTLIKLQEDENFVSQAEESLLKLASTTNRSRSERAINAIGNLR